MSDAGQYSSSDQSVTIATITLQHEHDGATADGVSISLTTFPGAVPTP